MLPFIQPPVSGGASPDSGSNTDNESGSASNAARASNGTTPAAKIGIEAPQSQEPQPLSPQLLHDLRTPLHQIIGYVEMLIEQAEEDSLEDFGADLQKVRVASGQLLAMFDRNFVARTPRLAASDSAANDGASHATPAPVAATPVAATPIAAAPIAAAPIAAVAIPSVALAATQPLSLISPVLLSVASPIFTPTTLLSVEAFSNSGLASGTEKGRVLIVDDNETNRDLLAHLLRRQKFQYDMAEDGMTALEMVSQQSFDLILLDIMMPQMDGYEVLKNLKADEATRHVPVIMISAVGEIDSVVRCIELGAEDYLPKPFNPTLLKARINACLEKKRSRDREVRLFAQLQENFGHLQALEKMRDDLTHMIVHDLRTPLSSLLAGLQTIPMVKPLEGAQQECLDIAMRGGYTLLNMINDLLDISKMESGQMELHRTPIEISTLIEGAFEQIASTARVNQLILEIEIEPNLPFLSADEDKLRRTLINLLGNAVKFTPRNGSVTAMARRNQNSVLFQVRDTGEGIPTAAFARIFDKFAQVENRRAGHNMSSGLGLALCKMVVGAHGGHIWVESQMGKGSTFSFTIPLQTP